MTSRINKAWHERHKMPKKATLEMRIRWHVAHAAHCGCRPLPRTVVAALKARGRAVPSRRN